MDAAAVSISNTLCVKNIRKGQVLTMAGLFGGFQAAMPLLGYFAAMSFEHYITGFDHWIALILLGLIGGKMLVESLSSKEDSCPFALTPKVLILQSIATSIDALAIGVSLSALKVDILPAVLMIGIITFICCVAVCLLSKNFGALLGKRAGIAGGIILIVIGLKIFIEHTLS